MSVFLSTPSARRATQGLEQYNRHNQNFYPRPLRGGRPSATAKYTASKNFYPRPLRGGRLLLVFEQAGLFVISIHALCEEGDRCPGRALLFLRKISIHALREEGDPRGVGRIPHETISIHALREEGDQHSGTRRPSLNTKFLSTPSARRATPPSGASRRCGNISIHALREEGDHYQFPVGEWEGDISIHALREEGDSKNRDKISIFKQIIQHSARI